MFLCNFYFLLKLYLFITGAIRFDILLNFLFFAFAVCPVPVKIPGRWMFTSGKRFLSIILGVSLLWYDSWLPPIKDALALLNQWGIPSFSYIIYFVGGFFNMVNILIFILILPVSFLLKKYKAVSTIVIGILIIAVPLIKTFSEAPVETKAGFIKSNEQNIFKDINQYLDSFYSSESERVILFKEPSRDSLPFDIVILHICSLSWDDLKVIGRQDIPFFKQFDYLFTGFNSATSYSNPSLMRLLQANCGQKSHTEIHNKQPSACFLFESFKSLGYENYVSMDHDGNYGNYLVEIKKNSLGDAKIMMPEKIKQQAVFFDNSPVYNDYEMLKRWFEARQSSKSDRSALYYNSILLHAGSHWVGEKKWWARDRQDQYEDVLSMLLKDLNSFIELLKSSKRNTVLIFIPDHGRGLSISPMQGSDLRDIPLPKLAIVPVGIKLIGPAFNNRKVNQQIISKPSSYLAISWMLSKFIENSPFGDSAPKPEEIAFKSPKTSFVTENISTENIGNKIVELNGKYYYYGKDKKWVQLTDEQLGIK